MFEPEVYRKQMYCIEKSTCDIAGTFRRPRQSFGVPRNDSAPPVTWRPGNYASLAPPLVTPLTIVDIILNNFEAGDRQPPAKQAGGV